MSTSVTGELHTATPAAAGRSGTPHRTIGDRRLELTAWLAHHPVPHPHLPHLPHLHLPHLHVPHPHLPAPHPHYDNNSDYLESSRMAREMGRL
ncbi:hypothetical protein MMAG44476_16030 [Mycolicibacterium mageritense DSM 44476 = CIP 104973]|uniref:Uncharacterized protein n=1 Tax=Mycolicibacterium mageritense TaxID=53462 RepID=A0ABM9SCX5_MYCME|nr:hypothetical protein [Mycolicibacterium mageritense]MCC9185548.1 hypothetical protein [Mycolicibacterium mageritense]BBX37888.1 hypothetical protein MMAGJ_71700 [Mycolicibacterium mageritense]CDO25442.1 hypothetical protein BN978_05949 [Mycolicibacterium mageritense DSM 44476 = CIP 104973]